MKSPKCPLCKDDVDTEHPESIYEYNPKTLRQTWMHSYCYTVALEELKDTPSSNPKYENKEEEYYEKCESK